MNNYKEWAPHYIQKGLSVIPDKFKQKLPAIKGWTDYCERLPTSEEVEQWSNMGATNIAIACGEASGVIALDFDCIDPRLIELIEKWMPESPVERIGSKGWVRFFKYNGEHSQAIKDGNKNVVFEILSNNKKCTIPPSTHPDGMLYKWKDEDLLNYDLDKLPMLPPAMISNVKHLLQCESPATDFDGKKIINGRNDALVSLCGKLIQNLTPLDVAIKELIKYDKDNHENLYFHDHSEFGCTEPFTNALAFFSSNLTSVNTRRMRKSQEYEIPITSSAINETHLEEVVKKKELQKDYQGKECVILPKPEGLLKDLQEYILSQSFVKQPALALSASIGLISTLICRKLTFVNNAPNLYLLNVAPSGAGKDAPQQAIKNILIDLKLTRFLGSGDYVSDASLMDGLAVNPVRIDIIDEASGLLKSVNKGGNTYDGKMADILCELFTSSNSRFLGRTLANGETRGECDRPGVSALMSTTPRGFQESLSIKAIEKGLLGRTLIFEGDPLNRAERIKKFPRLDSKNKDKINELANLEIEKGELEIGGIQQLVKEVETTPKASILLDEVFEELDNIRRNEKEDSMRLPIIARMFQQICKISLIHAASRLAGHEIIVDVNDIEFAKELIEYNLAIFDKYLTENIHDSKEEEYMAKVLIYLNKNPGRTLSQIYNGVRTELPTMRKKGIINLMSELKRIIPQHDGSHILYYAIGVEDED